LDVSLRASCIAIGLLACAFVPAFVPPAPAATGGPDFQDALSALQRGDSPTAEQKLRAELKAHPDEPEALSLLGVALDNQKKFAEADAAHRQAMAQSPKSAGILNNFGNHLLLTADPKGARDIFLNAVALDPADDYANLQLAQVALMSGQGQDALQYLDRLPAQQMEAPNMAILRLAALGLAGKRPEADALFNRLSSATENDPALSAALGLQLVQAGQFDRAETFLTHALAPDPTNFNLLYELGVVASRAGHNERARDVFEKALPQQPQNADLLYGLAFVYSALKQPEHAVRLLSTAARLAPQRPDVQKLLAVTTGDLRAYEDSVAAWDRYVTLAPTDDTGRRERGFARANIKQADAGMADLEWYAGRHPDDPTGLFELGVAQSLNDPEKGLATLDKAVALKPDFVDARSARGALNYQQGKAEAALSDLEFAAAKLPDSAMVLDYLGQTYLLLDRLPVALRVLRRAAELAPGDAKKQLHMANALSQADQTAESRIFMNRYRELGGAAAVPARGVLDYLSLTPEQQHAAYRARVEKGIADHPDDAAIQVSYLKLSIGDGQMERALAAAGKIAGMKAGAILLTDAGRAMLAARQYPMAKQLLEQALAADPAAGLDLDLAIVGFHTDGPAAGIQRLDRIPESGRGGDYYLARAEMLSAGGKSDEAIPALVSAVKAEPERADLYWRAAAAMTKNHRAGEALQLLDQASKTLSRDAQIPVIRAAVLELSGKTDEAQRLLADAQHRWPEVAAVWVAQGIILAAHEHADEARKALETAVSLGAHSPEMFYALAESSLRAGPEHIAAAETAVTQALKLAPDDAQGRALSGRIAARKSAAGSRDEAVDPAALFLSRPPQDW
jgi:tetratricopeptide (TPR) repeat protein